MNREHDETAARVEDALRRRAEALHDAPFTLEDVRGRARSIRRRRRVAAAGAALGVAAVVTPVALLATGGTGDDRRIEPAAPTEPLAYVVDGVLVRGGDRVPLAGVDGTLDGLATLADGRAVVSSYDDRGGRHATVLDAGGAAVASYPLGNGLAGDPAGRAAAWVTPDGVPFLVQTGGDPEELPPVRGRDLDAVDVRCDDGCTVTVAGDRWAWAVDTDREVRAATDGDLTVVDVSPDGARAAGLTGPAPDDVHSCGGVFDSEGGPVWEGCEHNVFEFAPDGAHLLAAFGEGLGPRYVALLDAATGREVTRLSGYDVVADQAWADDAHALAVAHRDGAWHLLRLGLDGDVEQLAGPFPGDELSPPVVLPER